ncbi:MAG: GMC family oxidoreductase [Myxococcaceae bacterium]|nr:GMC family oxidoreductase [Myxococcaceae bacterium]
MTPVGNTALTTFDAIVIGSGAGGSSAAYLLTKAGKKVLILEAGPNRFDFLDAPERQPVSRFGQDELKCEHRGFIASNELVDPRSFRNSPADGERLLVGSVNPLPRTVGGGAVHADLKMPRFMPQDFHLGTDLAGRFPGTSFADWPVDYDALEPWYTHAEKVLGVSGLAGADPFEGRRSGPLPMPPGSPMYLALKASDGLRRLGYHPFPYPMAINSLPYDGRPHCADCGLCSGYGCPTNAKGSPPVTTLRKAFLTGNCLLYPETRAVKLLTNGTRTEVTGVECLDPEGKTVTYRADMVVLAASPIEDTRLVLLSGGFGNGSGMLGRNLTFHFQTVAIGAFEERLHGHRGKTVSHGFSDFRGRPNDPDHPLGGIVEISGSSGPITVSKYSAEILTLLQQFDGPRFKHVVRSGAFRERSMLLAMQAEDAPQPTNVVDLDPAVKDLDGLPVARVTYRNHAFELSAREFYKPKLLEVLKAAGARWGLVLPADEISGSAHVHGTLRFGTDPKTSVCNPEGRFHEVGNLWNADGGLFPTSSGFNPTMTIMALAMRVGAAMAFPGNPEKALSQ